jgi:hypothetical protein
VLFALRSQDPRRAKGYWAIEGDKDEDLVIRHVVAFGASTGAETLKSALQRALGLLSGQTEPSSWIASGLSSDDIDWDEFDTAVAGSPVEMQLVSCAVVEPASVRDLFGARLGLLGIAPRLTDDGKIGWARIETPTELGASSIEVDEEMWSALDASHVEASLGGEALLSQIKIKCSHDYTTDKWSPPQTITWCDGIAERGRVRALTYDLEGLEVGGVGPWFADLRELRAVVASWTTAIHYGLFGRLASELEVPCVWKARQLKVGDHVKVTHPCLPDLPQGEIGMTARLGTVVGRKLRLTDDGADVLSIRIPAVSRASGIAPTAKGTNWNQGAKTLTFADADTPLYAADGGNDLDEFSVGDPVIFWEYGVSSPSGGWPVKGTIVTVDPIAKTVVLVDDIFGASLPAGGVWMTWPSWESQTPAQKLWISVAGSDGELGVSGDAGFEWGV